MEFWWCLKQRDAQLCACGILWSVCEAPPAVVVWLLCAVCLCVVVCGLCSQHLTQTWSPSPPHGQEGCGFQSQELAVAPLGQRKRPNHFFFRTQNEINARNQTQTGARHANPQLHQLTLEPILPSCGLHPPRAREVWSHHRRGMANRAKNQATAHMPHVCARTMAKTLTNFPRTNDRRATTTCARPRGPMSSGCAPTLVDFWWCFEAQVP